VSGSVSESRKVGDVVEFKLGKYERFAVGNSVGESQVGIEVGSALRIFVGNKLGYKLGNYEGFRVGYFVGDSLKLEIHSHHQHQ